MSDLISRQAAIEHLKKRLYETELNSYAPFPYYAEMADNRVSVWLGEVQTIEPKKGRWIEPTREGCWTYDKAAYAECSECGKKEYLGWGKNYCPNCGSFMGAEQKSCADGMERDKSCGT